MASEGTITLVPSVHFSRVHRRRVREAIREKDPDIVAVELDDLRFDRLQGTSRLGRDEIADLMPPATAATYRTLKLVQESVVQFYGLDPGKTDMETAVETATELNTEIALIDEPITQIFAALRTRVGLETIPKLWLRSQLVGSMDRMTQFKLMTIPVRGIDDGDDVQPVIEYMRRLLPEVSEILIDRRDRMMARRLYKLRREGYDVVAIIGAGHHNGIRRTLDELEARESSTNVDVPIRSPPEE